MDRIRISDVTMKQSAKDFTLSFKEKIEIPKLLDKLGVSVIELEGIEQPKIDALRVKSVAATVKSSVVAVPVALSPDHIEATWNALKEAKHPRLQVCASISTVQMEYLFKKKPEAMLRAIEETVAACCEKTGDVEFVAEDATRSDRAFLYRAIGAAIGAGNCGNMTGSGEITGGMYDIYPGTGAAGIGGGDEDAFHGGEGGNVTIRGDVYMTIHGDGYTEAIGAGAPTPRAGRSDWTTTSAFWWAASWCRPRTAPRRLTTITMAKTWISSPACTPM